MTTSPSDARGLYARLVAAQARLEAGVERDATYDAGPLRGRRYASAEGMIATCRAALGAEGLALLPAGRPEQRVDGYDAVDRRTGEARRVALLLVEVPYALVSEGGERVEVWGSAAWVLGDQWTPATASAAARTQALRDTLRDLLCVARTDGEGEGPTDRPEDAAPRPRPAPEPARPAPTPAPGGLADRAARLPADLRAEGRAAFGGVPADPSRDDLERVGWPEALAVQLAGGAPDAPAPAPLVKAIGAEVAACARDAGAADPAADAKSLWAAHGARSGVLPSFRVLRRVAYAARQI